VPVLAVDHASHTQATCCRPVRCVPDTPDCVQQYQQAVLSDHAQATALQHDTVERMSADLAAMSAFLSANTSELERRVSSPRQLSELSHNASELADIVAVLRKQLSWCMPLNDAVARAGRGGSTEAAWSALTTEMIEGCHPLDSDSNAYIVALANRDFYPRLYALESRVMLLLRYRDPNYYRRWLHEWRQQPVTTQWDRALHMARGLGIQLMQTASVLKSLAWRLGQTVTLPAVLRVAAFMAQSYVTTKSIWYLLSFLQEYPTVTVVKEFVLRLSTMYWHFKGMKSLIALTLAAASVVANASASFDPSGLIKRLWSRLQALFRRNQAKANRDLQILAEADTAARENLDTVTSVGLEAARVAANVGVFGAMVWVGMHFESFLTMLARGLGTQLNPLTSVVDYLVSMVPASFLPGRPVAGSKPMNDATKKLVTTVADMLQKVATPAQIATIQNSFTDTLHAEGDKTSRFYNRLFRTDHCTPVAPTWGQWFSGKHPLPTQAADECFLGANLRAMLDESSVCDTEACRVNLRDGAVAGLNALLKDNATCITDAQMDDVKVLADELAGVVQDGESLAARIHRLQRWLGDMGQNAVAVIMPIAPLIAIVLALMLLVGTACFANDWLGLGIAQTEMVAHPHQPEFIGRTPGQLVHTHGSVIPRPQEADVAARANAMPDGHHNVLGFGATQ